MILICVYCFAGVEWRQHTSDCKSTERDRRIKRPLLCNHLPSTLSREDQSVCWGQLRLHHCLGRTGNCSHSSSSSLLFPFQEFHFMLTWSSSLLFVYFFFFFSKRQRKRCRRWPSRRTSYAVCCGWRRADAYGAALWTVPFLSSIWRAKGSHHTTAAIKQKE